jgi:hypothetical protein
MDWDQVERVVVSIASIVAAIGTFINSMRIKSVHLLVNSRLSQLLKLTETSSFSAGEKAEKDKKDERP